jgi:hypothetical protein
MLADMLAISATWLVLVAVLCGIGLAIERLFGFKRVSAELALTAFWLGWAFVVTLVQVWHLFARIDAAPFLVVAVLGVAGIVWNAARLGPVLKGGRLAKLIYALVLCAFALWLSNRAMGSVTNTDAGLYHISSVRWASLYPVVPGLGNLHGRLAFNSSYFLFQAFLDIGPWSHRSHHLASGLLLFAVCAQAGLSAAKALLRRASLRPHDLLRLLLLGPVLRQCFVSATDPSPDVPVLLLGIVVGVQLCKLLFTEQDDRERAFDAFVIVWLSAVGISVKPSFVVVGFFSSLIAVGYYLWQRRRCRERRMAVGTLAWAAMAPVVVLVSWMAHGVFLSGYVAYPSACGSFDVEWKIPRKIVMIEWEGVRSWARQPHEECSKVLADWGWLGSWVSRMKTSPDVIVPLAMILAGLFIASCGRGRLGIKPLPALLVALPSVAAIIFWFFTAPHPRLAGAALWFVGAWAMLLASMRWWHPRHSVAVAIVALAVAGLVSIADGIKQRSLYVRPGPDNGFWPLPRVEVEEFVTDSGLVLYVPKGGESWDSPLPCTPGPRKCIRLRRPGDLGSGFVTSSPRRERSQTAPSS